MVSTIKFADYADRAALFELKVEQGTTVGALKAMAEERLSNSDDLCPMKYFDKWYLEVQVRRLKRLMAIDEGDEGLALAAAGLEDESVVYLEGPKFEEGQAEVGRAIAAERAKTKQTAQHARQVQGLMAEMCCRFDAIEAKQQELSDATAKNQSEVQQQSKAAKEQFGATLKQSEATSRFIKELRAIHLFVLIVLIGLAIGGFEWWSQTLQELGYDTEVRGAKTVKVADFDGMLKKFDALAVKQQELSSEITIGHQKMDTMAKAQSDVLSGNSEFLQKISTEVRQIKDWAGIQPMKAEVDLLLQKYSNMPLKALWEVLNDEANPGIDLPMAIIMDRRCGITRRAGLADGPMKSKGGFTINGDRYEGATPLIMAVLADRNDVVSALLANGADYEAVFTFRRWSALDIAAIINNAGAIKLLGNSGADASKRSNFNCTPLHEAAYQGHAAAIDALDRLRADVTVVNGWGGTPLQTFAGQAHAHLSEAEKVRLKKLLTPKPLGQL